MQKTPPLSLSSEVEHLVGQQRERYVEKLKIAGVENDVYLLPPGLFTDVRQHGTASSLPDFGPHDLYMYVVNNPSPYTGYDLKAFKSLDAYKYYASGHVTCLNQWIVPGASGRHLFTAKVCTHCEWYILQKVMLALFLRSLQVHHSCALTSEVLKPWAVIQKDGRVLCGHCTCKAGLGEVCSHIAALLYTLDATVKKAQEKSCTDGHRQWGPL
ncbi:uncharacterized protein LOC134468800 [Engraulis encrasicolus]|uniref:uncharacterized protein LOC134468800 n=1 Tax=Engraulis encrasicolus TaxID=184585 RepID=UPI002FD0A18F